MLLFPFSQSTSDGKLAIQEKAICLLQSLINPSIHLLFLCFPATHFSTESQRIFHVAAFGQSSLSHGEAKNPWTHSSPKAFLSLPSLIEQNNRGVDAAYKGYLKVNLFLCPAWGQLLLHH